MTAINQASKQGMDELFHQVKIGNTNGLTTKIFTRLDTGPKTLFYISNDREVLQGGTQENSASSSFCPPFRLGL